MEKMDSELAETLRSAELIVDIAAAVQQLCENSIDAGATGELLHEILDECSKKAL